MLKAEHAEPRVKTLGFYDVSYILIWSQSAVNFYENFVAGDIL